MKTEKSTDKEITAHSLTRAHYGQALAYSLMYGVIVTICLGLIFFFFPLVIVLVPFVIVPFTFALHYSISLLNSGETYSLGTFFKSFLLYYKPRFFGGYRLIHMFLKVLVFFLIVFEVATIPTLVTLFTNPEFMNEFNAVTTNEELINLLINNETYIFGTDIAFMVAMGLASFLLIHHLITNSIKITIAIHDNLVPIMAHISMIHHRKAFRKYRSNFYRDYFKDVFYIYILYPLFYAGGVLISYFFINKEADVCIIFGEIFGLVVLLPFLPLIINVVEVVTISYYDSFILGASEYTKEQLENILVTQAFSKEEKENILAQIKKIEEEIEKMKSEDNDEKDS